MNRAAYLAASLGLTFVVGCGPKTTGAASLCDGSASQPAACTATCDPAPGAAHTCPSGFHCSEDGRCDSQCTVGGSECPSGSVCTTDGRCIDDGSGTDTPLPDASCPAVMFTATQVTPSIGLVLDRSGSMQDNQFGGGLNRYQAMREAIVGTSGVVTQLQGSVYFGSELYTDGGTTCPNTDDVPRALNNAAAIRASIDRYLPSNMRGGNTPTGPAVDKMVATFAANPPPAGSPPVIVLATDGLSNQCDNGQVDTRPQSVAAVKAAHDAGIPVYVLAINQSAQHFQDLANAGAGAPAGTNAPYFVANNPTQLSAAFQQIVNGVVSCELTITGTIDEAQAASGSVTLNGTMLTYGTDWQLSSPTTIKLIGQACETLKSSSAPSVEATFPCGSIIGRTTN